MHHTRPFPRPARKKSKKWLNIPCLMRTSLLNHYGTGKKPGKTTNNNKILMLSSETPNNCLYLRMP